MKLPISIIVLTFNEEKNIEACLKSIVGFAEEIFIVDSYSNDRTLEIAKKYTDKIYQHKFENQAKQLNWALETLAIKTEWILRLDADEKILPELRDEIVLKLSNLPLNINGVYFKRRVFFLGKWIKWGGYYPTWLLRLWRHKKGYCENRLMDEHIKIKSGKIAFFDNDFVDHNQNGVYWWINKHNGYAVRESLEILKKKYSILDLNNSASTSALQVNRRRWLKENLYGKSPLFLRVCFYFIYRYLFCLGFLDGKEGLIFHFLQGFWYRFLVDTNVYEIEKIHKKTGKSIKQVILELHNISV
jgi:glycosyltransferase involved in cell wall biosynthesis